MKLANTGWERLACENVSLFISPTHTRPRTICLYIFTHIYLFVHIYICVCVPFSLSISMFHSYSAWLSLFHNESCAPWIGACDPFVVVELGRETVHTRVASNDRNPVWNESFRLRIPDHSSFSDRHDLVGEMGILYTYIYICIYIYLVDRAFICLYHPLPASWPFRSCITWVACEKILSSDRCVVSLWWSVSPHSLAPLKFLLSVCVHRSA